MLGCRQWRFDTGALGEAILVVDTITRAIDGAPECRIAQLVLERQARLNPRPRLRVNETRHSRLRVSCTVGVSDFAH